APPLIGAHPRRGDLCPAARGTAEIDEPHPRPQQTKPVVELDQLKGGARSIPKAVRLGDKGIVELAIEPFGGGGLAPPGMPYFDGKRPAAPAFAARHHVRSSRSMLRDSASFFIVAVVPLRAPVSICER